VCTCVTTETEIRASGFEVSCVAPVLILQSVLDQQFESFSAALAKDWDDASYSREVSRERIPRDDCRRLISADGGTEELEAITTNPAPNAFCTFFAIELSWIYTLAADCEAAE